MTSTQATAKTGPAENTETSVTSVTSVAADAAPAKPKTPRGPRAVKAGAGAAAAKSAKAAKAPPPTKAFEILEALKAASRDKEIDLERLVLALEEAIATAARKVYRVREMSAHFDPKTGDLTAWTPYRIVERKSIPAAELADGAPIDPDDVPIGQAVPVRRPLSDSVEADKELRLPWIELLPNEVAALLQGELAGKSWVIVRNPDSPAPVPIGAEDIRIGDEIRLYRSTEGLGRIAAQSAKQVLYQKVREAERDNIYNEYYPKIGELITGTVKRFERGDMIVDLGRSEAVIPREHQSRAERYTQGERVRGVLVDVHKNPKGSQLVLSRTAPELLIRLMEIEVPEIYDGTVVIRGCVRQPGDRAKVAVSSRERDVDPVGACVGMRGSRVQAIMRELRGERIDIIQYSDDLITYAQNALSPAKITRVSATPPDENAQPTIGPDGVPEEPVPVLECIVEEEQLSLAIGKRGQNVRLAAALIGARIEIKSEQSVKAEVAEALQRMLLVSQRRGVTLAEVPGLSEAVVVALQTAGFATVGDLLEAADDEDKAVTLNAVEVDDASLNAAIDLVRDFEQYSQDGDETDDDAEDEEEEELEADGDGDTDVEDDSTQAPPSGSSNEEGPESGVAAQEDETRTDTK